MTEAELQISPGARRGALSRILLPMDGISDGGNRIQDLPSPALPNPTRPSYNGWHGSYHCNDCNRYKECFSVWLVLTNLPPLPKPPLKY